MLGKKNIYRKPAVIIASVVILLLLNILVINNPAFAKRIFDSSEKTEQVSTITVQGNDNQQADQIEGTINTEGTETIGDESQKAAYPECMSTALDSIQKRLTVLEDNVPVIKQEKKVE